MVASWDASVAEELRLVEAEIRNSVQSRQPLLTEIAMHVINSGGKRMRPGIALLSFYCVGGKERQKIIQLAAAFELIHSATLVHDDINDGADTRRGNIAAYRKYGLQRALITGDFLFVQGFRLGGAMETQEVVEIVAESCSAMAESEILQIEVEHRTETPLETYMSIIGGKTARPIEASARVGAYIGEGSSSQIEALGRYGLNIGYAFQIVDDILDIIGKPNALGKPLGMDVLDSKANLPLMIAMQGHYPGSDRIAEVFKKDHKTEEEIDEVLALVRATDALDRARDHAIRLRDAALDALKDLPPSTYRDSLVALAGTVLERTY
ncbi:MAG: polyprenyl synthetase family protein [Methanomassiliicoccus sp.]|nr:polyprenyl synthetase family protein [Methanomassiliicoccus sp.]